ncbi:shikimate kinase [Lachnospiraceae bacterium A10]|jgi:shikimate kinase|nr:shikimate kinase [Lachnospiraceae bacterium A10]
MPEIESLVQNKNNIILIGMPGVGKSTVGVILAKVLGMSFIDSDLVIQEKTGKRLKEIISEQGIDGFNAVENQVNSELLVENSVIATGGSAVYGKEAMQHFQEIGTIVYLSIDYGDLIGRLGDLDERGVVHREGQTLQDIYEERVVLYEKYADITVKEYDGNINIESTVSAIVDAVKEVEK